MNEPARSRSHVARALLRVAALAGPWVEPFARLGYAANGIIYLTVGFLALRAATGISGDADVDRQEALLHIVTQPLGQALLAAVAVGLLGYAAGHLLMAARHPAKDDKRGLYALANRAAHAGSSLIYTSLAVAAAQLLTTGLLRAGNTPRDWTALVMHEPLGRWLVALGGVSILGISAYEFHKAYTAAFRKVFVDSMEKAQERRLTILGRVGYVARGITYGIIGGLVLKAAWQFDPQEAGGLGQALASLASQPYGPWLLGAVALGLVAYGLYGVLLGRYRDFRF